MSATNEQQRLALWNTLALEQAAKAILPCCGSQAWAWKLAALRPIEDPQSLQSVSDGVWWSLPAEDWSEAFLSHPRIGDRKAAGDATAESLRWSAGEQGAALSDDDRVKAELADFNRIYEEQFGRTFIVCATGKSSTEMLAILRRRLNNKADEELRETAEQQRQITQLRLVKWLRGE